MTDGMESNDNLIEELISKESKDNYDWLQM